MKEIGILDQCAIAARRSNRSALICGSMVGGFVPLATFVVAHYETASTPMMWLPVAGGLAYSAMTVFQWARVAYKHPLKALGFVVLLESVMTFSATTWLSLAALAMLIAINAIACACQLVLDRRETRKKK